MLTETCTDHVAICPGRTVIKSDNAYEKEIMPMAERSPLIQHAILSLSATYILDFKQHDRLIERANHHHLQAVYLLDNQLKEASVYEPGKEVGTVAALYIMAHNEVSSSH